MSRFGRVRLYYPACCADRRWRLVIESKSHRERMIEGDVSVWPVWSPERLDANAILAGWEEAFSRRGQPGFPATIQLYFHFAFCERSCRFCQYFHAVPKSADLFTRFTDFLVTSMERLRPKQGRRRVSNAYWGGGTPTALPTPELRRIVRAFQETFEVSGEFTSEAHPGNLDEDKIDLLREAGVNRLSMGFQSFDEGVLRHIFRTNPPVARLRDLVARARSAGMWVNTDLVLGLPQQTPESFRADLDEVLFRIRPSCLTIYRYQPTERLSEMPPHSMRYSQAIPRATIRRAMREGYIPEMEADDGAQCRFVRLAPAHAMWLARRGRYEVQHALRATSRWMPELPSYTCFEQVEAQLLGLGPGSISHLHGRAWYRDVTSLKNISGENEPVLLGTKLTPLDEARTEVLSRLHRYEVIDTRSLAHGTGADVPVEIDPRLVRAARAGALRRFGSRYIARKNAQPQAMATLVESLVPSAPSASDRRERAEAFDAMKMQTEYQPDLVKFFADNLRDSPGEVDGPGVMGEALQTWMRLMGIGGLGERLAGAAVVRANGDEICFNVRPEPAPALRVAVESDSGQSCYVRCGPYAISYVQNPGVPVAAEDLAFLSELRVQTERALAAPEVGAA